MIQSLKYAFEFLCAKFKGKSVYSLAGVLFVASLVSTAAIALAPQWWVDQFVIKPGANANDYAVANHGQLKNLAKAARDQMMSNEIIFQGDPIDLMVENWITDPTNAKDYAPLNVGQLKNVAKPFYDKLISRGLQNSYPWTTSVSDDNDYNAANIGQLKAVFAFAIPDYSKPTILELLSGSGQILPVSSQSQPIVFRLKTLEGVFLGQRHVALSLQAASGTFTSNGTLLNLQNMPVDVLTDEQGLITLTFQAADASAFGGAATFAGSTTSFWGAVGNKKWQIISSKNQVVAPNSTIGLQVRSVIAETGQALPGQSAVGTISGSGTFVGGASKATDFQGYAIFQVKVSSPGTSADVNLGGSAVNDSVNHKLTVLSIPSQPSNISAGLPNSNEFPIFWTDNANNEDGYRLRFAIKPLSGQPTNWQDAGSALADATSFTFSSLQAGTSYLFQVASYNASQFLPPSSAYVGLEVRTPPAAPSVPGAIEMTGKSANGVILQWQPPLSGANDYSVEQKINSGQWTLIASTTSGQTSYTVTNLNANAAYEFRVFAFNDSAMGFSIRSQASPPSLSSVLPAIPLSPTALALNPASSSQIQTFWTLPPNSGAQSVQLERYLLSGVIKNCSISNNLNTVFCNSTKGLVASMMIQGNAIAIPQCITLVGSKIVSCANTSMLAVGLYVNGPGIPVSARISTIVTNQSFTMNLDATISTTTTGLTADLLAPNSFISSITNATTFVLNEAPFYSGSGISLNISRPSPPSEGAVTILPNAALSGYLDSGLITENTYFYKLRSLNERGFSQAYVANTASTLSLLPTAPNNIIAEMIPGNNHAVKITWIDNANNENNYQLERRVNSEIANTLIPAVPLPPNTTKYIDSTIPSNATAVRYRVICINTAGTTKSIEECSLTLPINFSSNIPLSGMSITGLTGATFITKDVRGSRGNGTFTGLVTTAFDAGIIRESSNVGHTIFDGRRNAATAVSSITSGVSRMGVWSVVTQPNSKKNIVAGEITPNAASNTYQETITSVFGKDDKTNILEVDARTATGLTVDLTTNNVGAVTSVAINNSGAWYSVNNAVRIVGGGVDTPCYLKINSVGSRGEVTGIVILNAGIGYGSLASLTNTPTYSSYTSSQLATGLRINFSANGGPVQNVTIKTAGSGYSKGDILTIPGGTTIAYLRVLGTNNVGGVTAIELYPGFAGAGYLTSMDVTPSDFYSSTVTVDITASNGTVTSAVPRRKGSGYSVGDLIYVHGGVTPCYLRVTALEFLTSVANLEVINGGTGYQNGSSIGLLTDNSSNRLSRGLTVNTTTSNVIQANGELLQGVIDTVSINSSGVGYAVSDLIKVSGGDQNCTLQVTNIDPNNGSVISLAVISGGSGYTNTTGSLTDYFWNTFDDSILVYGSTLFVALPNAVVGGKTCGKVLVYSLDVATFSSKGYFKPNLVEILTAPSIEQETGMKFGASISYDESSGVLAIGSPGASVVIVGSPVIEHIEGGKVFLYSVNTTPATSPAVGRKPLNVTPLETLQGISADTVNDIEDDGISVGVSNSPINAFRNFGASVAVVGRRILIGAPGLNLTQPIGTVDLASKSVTLDKLVDLPQAGGFFFGEIVRTTGGLTGAPAVAKLLLQKNLFARLIALDNWKITDQVGNFHIMPSAMKEEMLYGLVAGGFGKSVAMDALGRISVGMPTPGNYKKVSNSYIFENPWQIWDSATSPSDAFTAKQIANSMKNGSVLQFHWNGLYFDKDPENSTSVQKFHISDLNLRYLTNSTSGYGSYLETDGQGIVSSTSNNYVSIGFGPLALDRFFADWFTETAKLELRSTGEFTWAGASASDQDGDDFSLTTSGESAKWCINIPSVIPNILAAPQGKLLSVPSYENSEQRFFKVVNPLPSGFYQMRITATDMRSAPADYLNAVIVLDYGAASNSNSSDSDGDGIPDTWEQLYGLNSTSSLDSSSDADGDGLTALEEYLRWKSGFSFGSNPIVWDARNGGDTDGDGVVDTQDAEPNDPKIKMLEVNILFPRSST